MRSTEDLRFLPLNQTDCHLFSNFVQAIVTSKEFDIQNFKIKEQSVQLSHFVSVEEINFSFSEKATKICPIFVMVLTLTQ